MNGSIRMELLRLTLFISVCSTCTLLWSTNRKRSCWIVLHWHLSADHSTYQQPSTISTTTVTINYKKKLTSSLLLICTATAPAITNTTTTAASAITMATTTDPATMAATTTVANATTDMPLLYSHLHCYYYCYCCVYVFCYSYHDFSWYLPTAYVTALLIVVVFTTRVNNSSATSPTAVTAPVIPSTPWLLPLPLQVLLLLLILGTLNSYALGKGYAIQEA